VDGQSAFPPRIVAAVKALACELPATTGLPLSRFSIREVRHEVIARGLVASIGETTLWRWLAEDAIRPWCHRSWIFPRAPDFEDKAGPILDLYQRRWRGRSLTPREFVLCADEKTSIQARQRRHPTSPPGPRVPIRTEHEYKRLGAWAYFAAWDVHRARVFGRCEPKTGIVPFERLVAHVMRREPYRSAKRVFWVVDNGSSHRGRACQDRLEARFSNITVAHTPVHASWINQVEIYFSIVQRKALTPNDFSSLAELRTRLLQFEKHFHQCARPFQWRFTRADLHGLLGRLIHPGRLRRVA
jgi:DDE superfamily endonuclease